MFHLPSIVVAIAVAAPIAPVLGDRRKGEAFLGETGALQYGKVNISRGPHSAKGEAILD